MVSGTSEMKTLADLSSAQVCFLVHEWSLSAMFSLGGLDRESFGAYFIRPPRDEASLGPDTFEGYHYSVPSL